MQSIVTGIDVGSHHVKVVIAQSPTDPRELPQILGTGYAESRGVQKGYVTGVQDAARSIAAALSQASKAARVKVKRAHLSIGGMGLEEAAARGEVVVERGDSMVTDRDLARAAKAAEAALAPQNTLNRRILHSIPLSYWIDGTKVLGKNPAGMKGARVSVEMLFVTALERHVHDLVEATESAGVEVEDVVASPIAASFVALNKMQKRVGCILCNIGAETTSVAVFEDSAPVSVKVFPTGGSDITNDLALGLRISPEEAEQFKLGAVLGSTFPKRTVETILNRRTQDLFKQVEAHLKKIGRAELLPAGVVLTGGGSQLHGAAELAKQVLKLPARIAGADNSSQGGRWQGQGGSWAVAYGLTVWGASEGAEFENHEQGVFMDGLRSLWRWFKKFLP
ncbi:MAG: cell division protein FtsA [Patescibacteria group bacterium]